MAVYVDDVRFRYRRMIMCHMWADALEELHAMADRIGVDRRWFQQPPEASWEHYDVCLQRMQRALDLGAVLTDRYGALEHVARRDGNTRTLERIQYARCQRPKSQRGRDVR